MYTLSKGPSKFVAKARRGLTQKLERLDSRDHTRRPADTTAVSANSSSPGEEGQQVMNGPKPVFHSVNRKSSNQRSQQEVITPQHEELIKFIYDSWSSVCKEYEEEMSQDKNPNTPAKVVYYESEDSNGIMQEMKEIGEPIGALPLEDLAAVERDPENKIFIQSTIPTGSRSTAARSSSDFKPFDLESWWGKRLYNNITKSL